MPAAGADAPAPALEGTHAATHTPPKRYRARKGREEVVRPTK